MSIARMVAEQERRKREADEKSKLWLQQAKQNQAEARGSAEHPSADDARCLAHVHKVDDDYDDFQQPRERAPSAPYVMQRQRSGKTIHKPINASRGSQQVAASRGVKQPAERSRQLPLKFIPSAAAANKGISTIRSKCNLCSHEFSEGELANHKFDGSDEYESVCEGCWSTLCKQGPWPLKKNTIRNGFDCINRPQPPNLKARLPTKVQDNLKERTRQQLLLGSPQRPKRRPVRKEGATKETALVLSDSEDGGGGDACERSGQVSTSAAALPARRSTRANRHMSTSERYQGLKALYPPSGGLDAVQAVPADLARLDQLEFLNDTVIDFYLRYLRDQLPPDIEARCHFFNSFFYKKLSEPGSGAAGGSPVHSNYHKVKKWTKGVDIFSKDFLFVPVHDDLHWSLVVVCYPGHLLANHQDQIPCILHLDSMVGGHVTAPTAKCVLEYLEEEWDAKAAAGEGVPGEWAAAHPNNTRRDFSPASFPVKRVARPPRQQNHCDCGLFLLAYTEFFCACLPDRVCAVERDGKPRCPPEPDVKSITASCAERFEHFLDAKWFEPANASNLRSHLRALILRFMIEQAPEQAAAAAAAAGEECAQYEGTSTRYRNPREWLESAAERKFRESEKKRAREEKNELARAQAAAKAEERSLRSRRGSSAAAAAGGPKGSDGAQRSTSGGDDHDASFLIDLDQSQEHSNGRTEPSTVANAPSMAAAAQQAGLGVEATGAVHVPSSSSGGSGSGDRHGLATQYSTKQRSAAKANGSGDDVPLGKEADVATARRNKRRQVLLDSDDGSDDGGGSGGKKHGESRPGAEAAQATEGVAASGGEEGPPAVVPGSLTCRTPSSVVRSADGPIAAPRHQLPQGCNLARSEPGAATGRPPASPQLAHRGSSAHAGPTSPHASPAPARKRGRDQAAPTQPATPVVAAALSDGAGPEVVPEASPEGEVAEQGAQQEELCLRIEEGDGSAGDGSEGVVQGLQQLHVDSDTGQVDSRQFSNLAGGGSGATAQWQTGLPSHYRVTSKKRERGSTDLYQDGRVQLPPDRTHAIGAMGTADAGSAEHAVAAVHGVPSHPHHGKRRQKVQAGGQRVGSMDSGAQVAVMLAEAVRQPLPLPLVAPSMAPGQARVGAAAAAELAHASADVQWHGSDAEGHAGAMARPGAGYRPASWVLDARQSDNQHATQSIPNALRDPGALREPGAPWEPGAWGIAPAVDHSGVTERRQKRRADPMQSTMHVVDLVSGTDPETGAEATLRISRHLMSSPGANAQ